jgi:hypothetical protein
MENSGNNKPYLHSEFAKIVVNNLAIGILVDSAPVSENMKIDDTHKVFNLTQTFIFSG